VSDKSSIEWTDVPTHAGYSVNDAGQIRGPSGRVLRPMRTSSGHLYVLTPLPRRPRKLFVHRAVLLALVGPPLDSDDEGRHLDGNPENNAVNNLAWGNRLQNAADRQAHGRYATGANHAAAVLSERLAREIRTASGSSRAVAIQYGVSHTTVLKIRRRQRWASA
jgi:hypothetical protein